MTHTVTVYDCAAYLRRRGFLIDGDPPSLRPHRVFIHEIQAAVCRVFEIPLREMTSARRSREVARPRQVAMYLSKQLTPSSLPEIGRRFGGRDHTTVIHAIGRIEKLRLEDDELEGRINAVEIIVSQPRKLAIAPDMAA